MQSDWSGIFFKLYFLQSDGQELLTKIIAIRLVRNIYPIISLQSVGQEFLTKNIAIWLVKNISLPSRPVHHHYWRNYHRCCNLIGQKYFTTNQTPRILQPNWSEIIWLYYQKSQSGWLNHNKKISLVRKCSCNIRRVNQN